MKDKPMLILTVGLPYSGKSSWAWQSDYPVVCPDHIRLALHGQRYEPFAEPMVWAIAKIMVRALFYSGHKKVVLDACNTTAKRRDEWKSEEWIRRYIVCDIAKEVCIARAQEDDDQEILPIIERMASRLEYDGILYGSGDYPEENRFMAAHIELPDGVKAPQIYHEGTAEDDI